MFDDRTRIQKAIEELNAGDVSAWDRLIPLVYQQLRAQAHAVLRKDCTTLQATEVLHDALINLLGQEISSLSFDGPGKFFALVSRVIRNRLSDHVRRRNAAKRGGGDTVRRLDPGNDDLPAALRSVDVVALHDVLDKLRGFDEQLWSVTELKYFCGLSSAEVAEALGVSTSSVERDWTFAKSWLYRQLDETR